MATWAFTKIQIGKEGTKGQAVAATAKLLGKLSMTEPRSRIRPDEQRGSYSRNFRQVDARQLAELTFRTEDAGVTFEQVLYFLHMAVKGNITAVKQGATGAYLWTFEPNLTTANDPDSFTFEYGDETQAWKTQYTLCRSLRIRGAADELWTLEADLFGRQMSTVSFASLTDPSVESAIFNKSKLYIDADGGTIGTTPKSGCLIDFDLEIPGFVPQFFGDGNLYFTNYSLPKRGLNLGMTLAFTSDANTERGFWASGAQRLIRIENTGSLIESPYYRQIRLDGAYTFEEWDTLDERDGITIVKATAKSVYNATWAKEWLVTVMNALSALP